MWSLSLLCISKFIGSGCGVSVSVELSKRVCGHTKRFLWKNFLECSVWPGV